MKGLTAPASSKPMNASQWWFQMIWSQYAGYCSGTDAFVHIQPQMQINGRNIDDISSDWLPQLAATKHT